MEKRQITMHDGRYLIFYTFEDAPRPSAPEEKEDGAPSERESDAKPEATEERHV